MFPHASFFGTWWSSSKTRWVGENVALLIVDYEKPCREPAFESALNRLKEAVHKSYKKFGRPQDIVWIIAEPVMRYY